MKSVQLSTADEYHLKPRNKIETLFSLLKGKYHLVTSKVRSIERYLAGIYAYLCAYQLCHQKQANHSSHGIIGLSRIRVKVVFAVLSFLISNNHS